MIRSLRLYWRRLDTSSLIVAVALLVVVALIAVYLDGRRAATDARAARDRQAICAVVDEFPTGDPGLDTARRVDHCPAPHPEPSIFGHALPVPTPKVVVSVVPSPSPSPVIVTRMTPVPGPTVTVTRTVTARPSPAPTVTRTVTETPCPTSVLGHCI